MRRRLIIVLGSAGVLLAALVGFNLFMQHFVAQMRVKNAVQTQTVSAATVRYADWQPEIAAVGSLRAVQGVDITTEVAGLVRSLHFKSGDEVRSGQVLVELNADTDVAQQHALEAAAELSQTVYTRDQAQYDAQAISKAQLDADAADLKSKRAQVAAQAATVAKKTLRAPFAGKLGITTVNPGQYLNTGDKVVSLQALDPIYIDFKLPQQQLAQVALDQTATVTTDAYAAASFVGKINAIDPRIDSSTRNFQAEATVPNSDHRLLPGMFGRIAVASGNMRRYLTVPQTAIAYNPYGTTVYIVRKVDSGHSTADPSGDAKAAEAKTGSSLIARQTFVTLGPTRGDQVAVLRGVDEGDLVVTSGQLKLSNGAPLAIDNTLTPVNEPDPTPQEQ
jgi:membrane fusion protein (multidrug efflux system)